MSNGAVQHVQQYKRQNEDAKTVLRAAPAKRTQTPFVAPRTLEMVTKIRFVKLKRQRNSSTKKGPGARLRERAPSVRALSKLPAALGGSAALAGVVFSLGARRVAGSGCVAPLWQLRAARAPGPMWPTLKVVVPFVVGAAGVVV